MRSGTPHRYRSCRHWSARQRERSVAPATAARLAVRHCSDVRHGVQEVKPYVDKASFAMAMLLALDGDKEWEATGAEHGIKLFRKPCACALLRARACASGCRRNDTPNLQTRRACARCGAYDGCAAT
jgi:hypothetical protein